MTEEPLDPLVDSALANVWATSDGHILHNVHDPDLCQGRGCVIHHPSEHHMREWPTAWRGDGPFDIGPGHIERVCEHGVGHPDPDDVEFWEQNGIDIGVHGCDGCCGESTS